MDFKKFCSEHRIQYFTEGHKHCRPGWLNLACPFCWGHDGYHLGYCEQGDFFSCWRCGFHPAWEVVASLLNLSRGAALDMVRRYRHDRPTHSNIHRSRLAKDRVPLVVLPFGSGPLAPHHNKYLQKRGFSDPSATAELWRLYGTGIVGPYKLRIIAPIYFGGVLVSFQGRDITERSPLKYKACEQTKEARDHKTCLYGIDEVPGDTIIVTEGIVDVWKIGPGAVATFGIKYTPSQLRLISRFQRRFILFDSGEPEAVNQARKLAGELAALGGTTEIVTLDYEDPGEMSEAEGVELRKSLLE